jgi:hypothetical protein
MMAARRSTPQSAPQPADVEPRSGDAAPRDTPPERYVPVSDVMRASPLVTFPLRLEDRVLVAVGDRVEAGQPLIERCRETSALVVPGRAEWAALAFGEVIDAAHLEGHDVPHGQRPGDRVRYLYRGADGRDRLCVGRHPRIQVSPLDGLVEVVEVGALRLRAGGLGVRVGISWGTPTSGHLMTGVATADAELRASNIDVGAAGAVVVAGARVDIEALTRARAIGAAGVICGGVAGRDLRQLEASDRRQRAALHPGAPFALVALDGYGRRPMPGQLWDLLQVAEGRMAALVPEAHLLVVSGDPAPLLDAVRREPRWVRVAAGEGLGVEGRLAGLAGPVRTPAGPYAPAAFVDVPAAGDAAARRQVVALADLERFG